jgi:hypothetical protein
LVFKFSIIGFSSRVSLVLDLFSIFTSSRSTLSRSPSQSYSHPTHHLPRTAGYIQRIDPLSLHSFSAVFLGGSFFDVSPPNTATVELASHFRLGHQRLIIIYHVASHGRR